MFKILTLTSILFLSSTLYADHDDAKELFKDADCMSCHNNEDFSPREKKIKNFRKLHMAVDACRFANDADWFDDESDEVTEYLNDKFYHFKKK